MLLDLLFLFSCFVSCFLALFSHSNTLCKVCFKTQYNKIKLTCLLKRHLAWWPSGAAASALLIGQFNLAESGCCSEGFPPYKWHRGSREGTPTLSFTFFPASAIFLHLSLSLPLSSLWVVMEMKARGGVGASIIDTVVGLVVGWELGIVKWSDSCTHKQRVRWSRREVEGLGVR